MSWETPSWEWDPRSNTWYTDSWTYKTSLPFTWPSGSLTPSVPTTPPPPSKVPIPQTDFTGPEFAVGTICGVRHFTLDARYRLISINKRCVWVPGENIANCQRNYGHEAPQATCQCGFYAYFDLRNDGYNESRGGPRGSAAHQLTQRAGTGGSSKTRRTVRSATLDDHGEAWDRLARAGSIG